ncbi:MAG: hypothetical protein FJ303_21810 [Planctomycetes bacterium]|nr:hypothetical protein [Planctomycetota bacterium]
MLHTLQNARALAKKLDEPWWEFLFDVWIEIAYETHMRDLQNGLRQALYCINEARKPILRDHPWRVAAHNNLLACYVLIDPVGYAKPIRQCIRELNQEIPAGPGPHRYIMMDQECELLMALNQLKKAENVAIAHLALADKDSQPDLWYTAPPLLNLCWLQFRKRDWEKLQAFATQAETVGNSLEHAHLWTAEAMIWQAVVARQLGDEARATRIFQRVEMRVQRLAKLPSGKFYDAVEGFHQQGEDLEKALLVREDQLARIAGKGRHGYECDVQIKCCDLLARLGRLTSADLDRATALTAPLKAPKRYQTRIKKLASQRQEVNDSTSPSRP